MFDGFKILLLNSLHILENSLFEEVSNFCNKDGELHKTVYKYKGVTFHHFNTSDTILMYGSFHKYWNDGVHNYNNFNYNNYQYFNFFTDKQTFISGFKTWKIRY